MDDQASTTAGTLELLHLNQVAIRAVFEEVSLGMSHLGDLTVHNSDAQASTVLNLRAEAISAEIKRLCC